MARRVIRKEIIPCSDHTRIARWWRYFQFRVWPASARPPDVRAGLISIRQGSVMARLDRRVRLHRSTRRNSGRRQSDETSISASPRFCFHESEQTTSGRSEPRIFTDATVLKSNVSAAFAPGAPFLTEGENF